MHLIFFIYAVTNRRSTTIFCSSYYICPSACHQWQNGCNIAFSLYGRTSTRCILTWTNWAAVDYISSSV